ncbi:hypothetical protein GOP47_0005637 [Adiantum capillus-veneris]|uniref:Uncharacterized protein n=1 Tax=Adiantum capillus-veneris TaxID=13818 RepID=A0A9D4V5R8_ADICA|nr:hypothetical protein GOP47_0005637 [Adiantum capillus-veneris]
MPSSKLPLCRSTSSASLSPSKPLTIANSYSPRRPSDRSFRRDQPNMYELDLDYFISLPTGRDGYLPVNDLVFSGGLAILCKLFKEGQEITVRIVCCDGAGREIVSMKKPEFARPSEQKTIETLQLLILMYSSFLSGAHTQTLSSSPQSAVMSTSKFLSLTHSHTHTHTYISKIHFYIFFKCLFNQTLVHNSSDKQNLFDKKCLHDIYIYAKQ